MVAYLCIVKNLSALLLTLFLLLLTIDIDAQCVMCKAVVESAQHERGMLGGSTNVGEGLNKGIIFLMIMPYVLLFILFRRKIGAFLKELGNAQG